MNQAAHDSGAAADLSRHLQKGSTGRLSSNSRGVDVDVYVMNGQVVAAESGEDIKLLLRRLYAAKALSRARAAELGGLADLGEAVFGMLLEEIDTQLMDQALFERFRDNVCRYLGVRTAAEFHPMGAVFVENFQMGHDTSELLLTCAKMWRQSRHVPLSMVLAAHHPDDATGEQVLMVNRLDGRRTVRQILHDVPLEPVYGRAILAQMLSNGIVRRVSHDRVPTESSELESDEDDKLDPYEEANTSVGSPTPASVASRTVSPVAAPTAVAPVANDDDHDDIDLAETEVVEMTVPSAGAGPEQGDVGDWDDYLGVGLQVLEEPEDFRRGLPAGTDAEDLDEDSPTVMADYNYQDGEPNTADHHAASVQLQEAEPTGWLSVGVDNDVDDDIMEAFADYDSVRGADGDGSFSQEQLERVEVASLPPIMPTDDSEVIEAGDGQAGRFGARVLATDEAQHKVEVANDNLRHLVRGFDAASGSGRGRAAIQLLVEGCPNKFTPLFHDVIVRPDGTVPLDRLLRNLQVRPATEHRQLLNSGLMDLIERGLSVVMDELDDDDDIDEILESTAGYRQRIGL